jgi:hypothetical protein
MFGRPICLRYCSGLRHLSVQSGKAGDLPPQRSNLSDPALPLLVELLLHCYLGIVEGDERLQPPVRVDEILLVDLVAVVIDPRDSARVT